MEEGGRGKEGVEGSKEEGQGEREQGSEAKREVGGGRFKKREGKVQEERNKRECEMKGGTQGRKKCGWKGRGGNGI